MLGEEPIEFGQEFTLLLEAPGEDGGQERLAVQVRSIWSTRGANPDFYKIGFYLIDSLEEVISAIRKMVDEFGRNRQYLLRG